MKYEFDFSNQPNYAIMRVIGIPNAEEWAKMLNDYFNHPEWADPTNRLMDLTDMDFSDLSSIKVEELLAISKSFKEKFGKEILAVVVKDPLSYGTTRMFGLMGGENLIKDSKLFYSLDEAKEWLVGA